MASFKESTVSLLTHSLSSLLLGQDREWVYNRDKIVIKGKLRVRVPEISAVADLWVEKVEAASLKAACRFGNLPGVNSLGATGSQGFRTGEEHQKRGREGCSSHQPCQFLA